MKYVIALLACAAAAYGGTIAGGTPIQSYTIGIIAYFFTLISFQLGICSDDEE